MAKSLICYHYSKEPRQELKTLRVLHNEGVKSQKQWGEIPNLDSPIDPLIEDLKYADHISCFTEPVPLDIISRSFNHKSPFWIAGSYVYEHRFIVKQEHLPFVLLESPERTKMYYDPSVTDEQYFREVKRLYSTLYYGQELEALAKVFKHLEGSVRQSYLDLRNRPNFKGLQQKYAATVPHLALFPTSGVIKPDQINRVRIS